MKRIFLAFVLFAVITTGSAFATHPKGLGIGLFYGASSSWGASGWGYGYGHDYYGLSLKIPSVPIFWGVHMRIKEGFFSLGVIGDYYLIDSVLVKDIGLHWFLGLGFYGSVAVYDTYHYSYYPYYPYYPYRTSEKERESSFGLGGRLPIGLSWQPVKPLEIYLNLAPSLGLHINPLDFPDGGIGLEIGIRVWF